MCGSFTWWSYHEAASQVIGQFHLIYYFQLWTNYGWNGKIYRKSFWSPSTYNKANNIIFSIFPAKFWILLFTIEIEFLLNHLHILYIFLYSTRQKMKNKNKKESTFNKILKFQYTQFHHFFFNFLWHCFSFYVFPRNNLIMYFLTITLRPFSNSWMECVVVWKWSGFYMAMEKRVVWNPKRNIRFVQYLFVKLQNDLFFSAWVFF